MWFISVQNTLSNSGYMCFSAVQNILSNSWYIWFSLVQNILSNSGYMWFSSAQHILSNFGYMYFISVQSILYSLIGVCFFFSSESIIQFGECWLLFSLESLSSSGKVCFRLVQNLCRILRIHISIQFRILSSSVNISFYSIQNILFSPRNVSS
jgi:hypothetical protein